MTERINPVEELSRGYQNAPPIKTRRYYDEFHKNSEFEQLLTLRRTDPAKFDALPSDTKIQLGCYENHKQDAKAFGKKELEK